MTITTKKIPAPDLYKIERALISVFDKTGLEELAKKLHAFDITLISTGGTARTLKETGLPVQDVSDLTAFPEIMDGRVKTLHPHIHGGLLGVRNDPDHIKAMQQHDIKNIDLLIVNLYPFEQMVGTQKDAATIIEHIDIGGPALIRAGAKNHAYVAVITDPQDYDELLEELERYQGALSLAFRKKLAARAFARAASYDAHIAKWFQKTLQIKEKTEGDSASLPRDFTLTGRLESIMRYGENPHQFAGFYLTGEKRYGVATASLLQGKKLSYNNINDTDAAFELVSEFDPAQRPAVAIIKHANPCGVAQGSSLKEAYLKALACDNLSAFGGIVAMNTLLDAETAEEIIKTFTEVIIAPDVSEEAQKLIAKKKNLRLLTTGGVADPRTPHLMAKTVAGGLLVQSRDDANIDDFDLKVVTKRAPTAQELEDLKFAYRVVKHVKSNAIVYAKNHATVGIGAGQMSRVDSARIAAQKALDAAQRAGLSQPLTHDSVAASDAFFPFADGLISIVEAGAKAIIQPGGSMRDAEVIAAADERGIAMVFTGMRHFRH